MTVNTILYLVQHADVAEFYLNGYPEYKKVNDAPGTEDGTKVRVFICCMYMQ